MSDPQAQWGLLVLVLSAAAMVAFRPRDPEGTSWGRVAAFAALAAAAAFLLGAARLVAIDGGAYRGPIGRPATATGTVAAVPRRSHGEVRAEIETGEGKLLLLAHEPVPDLPVGAEVRAAGTLGEPDPFLAPQLRRHGIAEVLATDRIELTGRSRGGLAGALDLVRSRAELALGRGMREPESALARGFVLGEDDRIDPDTVDDFKRSGLAHHLAVSGENVLLLAVLAMPILALAGFGLRGRLFCVLALIAVYVPVAGGGASIQRAGIMGAAGVVAMLAGRPRSRFYAVLLAAFVTLAINPRAGGDIGWQLSFAAVIGIFLWARRIALLLPGGGEHGGWRRALADGAALTVAATVATAPLMAHHFDRVSLASLPANLLALPAVAPAMWLGMLSGAAGQVPATGGLLAVLNAVNQLLLAYVEQIAHWLAAPSWAVAPVGLENALAVAVAYAVLLPGVWLALRAAERRRELGFPPLRPARPAVAVVALAIAVIAIGLIRATRPEPSADSPGAAGEELSVSVLDVGQGDAILLQPPGAGAVLIDGGPPGDDLRELLADHGVEELATAIVTHDQSDHAGGIEELLGRIPVGSLDYATASPQLLGVGAAAGARQRLAEGDEVRSGDLRLEVLWPPGDLLPERPQTSEQLERSGIDPNRLCLVMLAEWRHFSILLTGDAEAEAVPIDPGPIDVLKVAHHGSADSGLAGLLDRVVPDLAVISVGEDNPYGHPAPEALAVLRDHALPTMRTDENGTIEIDADASGWTVASEG